MAKILTWRWKPEEKTDNAIDPAEKKKNRHHPRQREMFVKWQEKSYWNCEWVSELQVINK